MSGGTNNNACTELVAKSAIALGTFLQSHTRETLKCGNPNCAKPFGQKRKCYIACAPAPNVETSDAAPQSETSRPPEKGSDESCRVCLLCEDCVRYTDEEVEEFGEYCTDIENNRWSKNCDMNTVDMRCRNCERLNRPVRNLAFARPGYAQEFHDHLEGMQVFDEGMAPLIDKAGEEQRREVETTKRQHKAKCELRKEQGKQRTAALWEVKKELDASDAQKRQLADQAQEEAYQLAIKLSEEKAAEEIKAEEDRRREAAKAKQLQIEAKRQSQPSSDAKSAHRQQLKKSINEQRGSRVHGKKPKNVVSTEDDRDATKQASGAPSASTARGCNAAAENDELEEWDDVELFAPPKAIDPVPVAQGVEARVACAPITDPLVLSKKEPLGATAGVAEHEWYKQIQAAVERIVGAVGDTPSCTPLQPATTQEETRDLGARVATTVDWLCAHIDRMANDLADADRAATFFGVELFKKRNKHAEVTHEALTSFVEKYGMNPRFLKTFEEVTTTETAGRKRKRRADAQTDS